MFLSRCRRRCCCLDGVPSRAAATTASPRGPRAQRAPPRLGLPMLALQFCFVAAVVSADISVIEIRSSTIIAAFRDAEATFGAEMPDEGMQGYAVQAEPLNACRPIRPPPKLPQHSNITHWIVVIARYGGCNFQQKLDHATGANFSAAIVFNVNSDKLVPMGGNDNNVIPSVFIGYTDAEILLRSYIYDFNKDVYLWISGEQPFDINAYLLPFAIVVGVCFLVMLAIVVWKCIQDHRRTMRHRLPKSALKKIPTLKFKDGDPYETCCICLEDYKEGDKLRILPCDHGYHAKCIDPWLLKNRRICPQCRQKVFGPGENKSDSDEEEEESGGVGGASASGNERTPLVPTREQDVDTDSNDADEDTLPAARLLAAQRRNRRFPGGTFAAAVAAAARRTASSSSSSASSPRSAESAAAMTEEAYNGGAELRRHTSAAEAIVHSVADQLVDGFDSVLVVASTSSAAANESSAAAVAPPADADADGAASVRQERRAAADVAIVSSPHTHQGELSETNQV